MRSPEWSGISQAAARTLDDLDSVLAEVSHAMREKVPEYGGISDEHLIASASRNVSSLLMAIRDRRGLTTSELDVFRKTVEQRARDGVPIDQYLLAVATAEEVMWDQLWARADQSVGEKERLEAFRIRFANFSAVARITANAHRRIELVAAREDHERRALAVRSLLRGLVSGAEAGEHMVRLGLDAGRSYVVVRSRGLDSADSEVVQQRLAGGRIYPPFAAFVLWGDDVVGLLADRPAEVQGLVAGVSEPVTVAELPEAHDRASLAFATAWRLGLEGSFTLDDLGLKVAVVKSPEVGSGLREKYLAPLRGSGTLGEQLLATVRAFLETGGRKEATAARLFLHTNTISYRLTRFCELTGADLADLETLAELWWLFTDMDLGSQPRPRSAKTEA